MLAVGHSTIDGKAPGGPGWLTLVSLVEVEDVLVHSIFMSMSTLLVSPAGGSFGVV